jgi:transposase
LRPIDPGGEMVTPCSCYAIRFSPPIRRWYDRKCGKRHKVIATKAVAHKLARAGYFLMRDGGTFDVQRAFS